MHRIRFKLYLRLFLLRSTMASASWIGRHFPWEGALVIATATASALRGFASEGDFPAWQDFRRSILTGFAALGILWLAVLLIQMARAPAWIRQRLAPRNFIRMRGRVRGAKGVLEKRAMALIPPIRKFGEDRPKWRGRGIASEVSVWKAHRDLMMGIEGFGQAAAQSTLQTVSRRERAAAFRLYEAIRSLPIDFDIELVEARIREFSIHLPSRLERLGERWSDLMDDYSGAP